MKHYAFFFAALILGLSAGLYYGWVINPVEGLPSSADTLRLDYQADFVLVVSEIFASDQRPDRAIERLRLLESENPLDAIAMALDFANLNGMANDDLSRIQALDDAIRAWEPRLAETASP